MTIQAQFLLLLFHSAFVPAFVQEKKMDWLSSTKKDEMRTPQEQTFHCQSQHKSPPTTSV